MSGLISREAMAIAQEAIQRLCFNHSDHSVLPMSGWYSFDWRGVHPIPRLAAKSDAPPVSAWDISLCTAIWIRSGQIRDRGRR